MNYKIVVTGGSGYIGQRLIEGYLEKYNSDILVIDKELGSIRDERVKYIKADLSSSDLYPIILENKDYFEEGLIYHLSGLYVKDIAMRKKIKPIEYEINNVIATQNFTNALLRSKIGLNAFIFSSTILCNSDPAIRRDSYPLSKLKAEEIIRDLHEICGSISVLRLARVLGSGYQNYIQTDIISDFMNNFLSKDNKQIFIKKSKNKKNYIHISDIVKILLSIPNKIEGYREKDIGTQKSIEIGNLAEILFDYLQENSLITNDMDLILEENDDVTELNQRIESDIDLDYRSSYDVIKKTMQEYLKIMVL